MPLCLVAASAKTSRPVRVVVIALAYRPVGGRKRSGLSARGVAVSAMAYRSLGCGRKRGGLSTVVGLKGPIPQTSCGKGCPAAVRGPERGSQAAAQWLKGDPKWIDSGKHSRLRHQCEIAV